MTQKVACIAGLGQLGTSLGLALAQDPRTNWRRVAWDSDEARMDRAESLDACDEITVFPQDDLATAALVITALTERADRERFWRAYVPSINAGALWLDFGRFDLPEDTASALPEGVRRVALRLVNADTNSHEPSTDWLGQQVALVRTPEVTDEDRALLGTFGLHLRWVQASQEPINIAATEQLPWLNAAAHLTTLAEMSPFFTDLKATPAKAISGSQGVPAGPPGGLRGLEHNQQALLSVLGRQISVMQDLRRWLELGQWNRVEAFIQEAIDAHQTHIAKEDSP